MDMWYQSITLTPTLTPTPTSTPTPISTPTLTPTPTSTPAYSSIDPPTPEKPLLFYGWFSLAQQQMRVLNPTKHVFNGLVIYSPPYTYYLQGDKKVLVTEITHSPLPTYRQIKNGDICIGLVDGYYGRVYNLLE